MIRKARSTARSSSARLLESMTIDEPARRAGRPSMTKEPKWTPITTPSELSACARFSRKWLRRGEPSSAARGFAATWSAVKPPASTNKAARIGSKPLAPVLATTRRQPHDITPSEPRIMSTAPRRAVSHAAGRESSP